jgi:MYXO-CTERM domain-containing protein
MPAYGQQDLGEPTATGCPLDASAKGTTIRRTFTSTTGRTTSFSLQLPADFDAAAARGIVLYLHGNDDDQGGNFYPELYRVPENTERLGLVPAVAMSPDTRTNADGSVVRDWRLEDDVVLEQLLDSDFGGCLKLDRDKVYFAGESQGTCMLSQMLTSFLWRKYRGGVLGYCGCWGFHEYSWPVDPAELRGRFKVFVENTTEDFLHNRGLMGFDHYQYNYGLDVRSDLMRAGSHCVDARIHGAEALSWMLGQGEYPKEETFEPSWQQLDSNMSYSNAIAINAQGRVVTALGRPTLTLEQKEQVGQKRRELGGNVDAFNEWALSTFPEFERPPIQIAVSDDYGETWTHVTTRDTLLFDALASSDGHFYIATRDGILRDDGTGKAFAPYALVDQRVDALEEDELGTLYAYGAVLSNVKRSKDRGVTWEDLPLAPTPVGALARERDMLLYSDGVLTAMQDNGTVLYSADHGDTWNAATLPATPLAFTHFGPTFYLLSNSGMQLHVSSDSGQTWATVTLPVADFLRPDMAVTQQGHLVVQGSELAYRSRDKGVSFSRERGLHSLMDMTLAFNANGQAVASGLRGIFRYQDMPPQLPVGGAGGAINAAGSAGLSGTGGTGGGTTSSGGAVTNPNMPNMQTPGGTPSEGGCGCRVAGQQPSRPLLGALLLGLVALRRRQQASRRPRSRTR